MAKAPVELADIVRAQSCVYEIARKTPIDILENLSYRLNHQVFVKREDLQSVRSFKNRGAYVKMRSLSSDQRSNGVIAASAGNHAQGVALSGKHLNIKTKIVMPKPTASIKVSQVRSYGAGVVLFGDTYDDACSHAKSLQLEDKSIFIHPFDDPLVIAGQGTIGLELLEQNGRFDYLLVPVGGGGLISGLAVALKSVHPDIKIIGVESSGSACFNESVKSGRITSLERISTFAEGVAVKKPGHLTYKLCKEYVDDWLIVSDDEICAAIRDVYDDLRVVPETAGAVSIAGAKKFVREDGLKSNSSICCILSGANLDFIRLKEIAERAEIGEKEEYFFSVLFPERPGALHDYLDKVVGQKNISLFQYRKKGSQTARVLVGIEMQGKDNYELFMKAMQESNFVFEDVTHNTLLKDYII